MILKYEIYTTNKNKEGIIVDGHLFYAIDSKKNTFRCTSRGCNARASVINEINVILKNVHTNHEKKSSKLIFKKSIIEKTKQLAQTSFLKPIEILCEIKKNLTILPNSHIQSDKHLKAIINKERNISDNHINDSNLIFAENYLTINNKKFVQYIDYDNGNMKTLIIFNEENLLHLKNCKTWVMDGTFYSCPKNFTQIYVLHGSLFGKMYPLAYLLLSEKSFACYYSAFTKLNEFIDNRFAENVVIDFEIAVYKALNEVFIGIKIFYCNFHLGQTFYRNIQKKGLSSKYNKNFEFKKYCKMILSLAFDKPHNVAKNFILLSNKLLEEYKCPELISFLNYFDKTFIGLSGKAIFCIENWSTHYRIINDIPTTTNFAEAWNKHLNAELKNPHPKINNFLKELKYRDYLTSIKITEDLLNPKIEKPNVKLLKFKEAIEKYENFYDLTFLYLISYIKEEIY